MSRAWTALLAMTLFSGCGVLHPKYSGSGIQHTEFRDVAPFEEIKLSGFGKVNVVVGDEQSVCLTTDDNLLHYVETEVEGGKLKIRPKRSIRPTSGLTVDVTVPRLTSARVSGAGDINVAGMQGEHLDLRISGAGTLTASGQVSHISTSISGAGSAELQHLFAETAEIDISGAGTAHVFATESVDADVSGAGNVVCYGNPRHIDQSVSGAGNVSTGDFEGPTEITLGDVDRRD